MMKTPSDKAVTNQSHRRSRRTVRDISGQSSHALVRRGKPVTANSNSSVAHPQIMQENSLLLLFSIPSHPRLAVPPPSFFHFCHPLIMLYPARGGQTEGHRRRWCEWTGGCALLRLLDWRLSQAGLLLSQKPTHAPNTHTRQPQTALLLPTCQNVYQHWHCETPAQFFSFPSVFAPCSFHAVLLLTSIFNPVPILLFASLSSSWYSLSPTLALCWPHQCWLLQENELNHSPVMEHATSIVNTHTHTHACTHTFKLKQQPLPSDLFPPVYMFIIWPTFYWNIGLMLFLSALQMWMVMLGNGRHRGQE